MARSSADAIRRDDEIGVRIGKLQTGDGIGRRGLAWERMGNTITVPLISRRWTAGRNRGEGGGGSCPSGPVHRVSIVREHRRLGRRRTMLLREADVVDFQRIV